MKFRILFEEIALVLMHSVSSLERATEYLGEHPLMFLYGITSRQVIVRVHCHLIDSSQNTVHFSIKHPLLHE